MRYHYVCYFLYFLVICAHITVNQFVIFKPWKVPWSWIDLCWNSFVMSRGLIRGKIRGHANEAAQKIIPKDSLLRLRKLIWLFTFMGSFEFLAHSCHYLSLGVISKQPNHCNFDKNTARKRFNRKTLWKSSFYRK